MLKDLLHSEQISHSYARDRDYFSYPLDGMRVLSCNSDLLFVAEILTALLLANKLGL